MKEDVNVKPPPPSIAFSIVVFMLSNPVCQKQFFEMDGLTYFCQIMNKSPPKFESGARALAYVAAADDLEVIDLMSKS